MANDLTMATDATDGPRDPAWRALSLLFSPTEVVRAQLGDDADAAIDAALAKTDAEMRPVPTGEAGRDGWEAALDERLRRLAAKVLPTAGDAANAWRAAMVEALSDLPAMIALTAAKKAIHQPFRFVGEIEPAIRELAAQMIDRRRLRRDALERMRADLRRAATPAPALPAPAAITADGIRAMTPDLRRLGLRLGFITQADVDAALGAEPQQQAA